MAYIIKIPKLGLTMTEGTINVWCKSEGATVKKEEVLLEISTDKLTNEIEAEEDGVLRKILVEEGETREVLCPIGIIAQADEDISELLKEACGNSEENSQGIEGNDNKEDSKIDGNLDSNENKKNLASHSNSQGLASPYAKYLAKERNIVISQVVGSGPRSMVIAKDLENIKDEVKASPLANKIINEFNIDKNDISCDKKIMKDDVINYLNSQVNNTNNLKQPRKEKATPIRKVIAKNMKDSYFYSPVVTFNIDIDATKMKELRNALKEDFIKENTKLTFNHILMKVCSKTLIEYPYMNSNFDGEEITIYPYTNIALAIDGPSGLIVPHIKNVEEKSLLEISKATEDIISRAKASQLEEEDLVGSTFTITNLGSYEITGFTPIIKQPEVAILGVNAIVEKPIVEDSAVVIKPILSLSLTADHRLIDGVYAAKFLSRVKQLLENPLLLI